MKLFGLIGDNLSRSRSVELFDKYVAPHNHNCEYRNFELTDIGELTELLAEWPDIEGFNVTAPFKEDIMTYIDRLSETAARVGAVNCVKVEHDHDGNFILHGHNTDVDGFLVGVTPLLPYNPFTAIVLGTGGASKAVVEALKTVTKNIVVVSRRPSEGVLTYADLKASMFEGEEVLVVNATPVCPEDFPFGLLRPQDRAYDLNYAPAVTEFMSRAAQQGATVANGLGMLLAQARLSWHIWGLKSD